MQQAIATLVILLIAVVLPVSAGCGDDRPPTEDSASPARTGDPDKEVAANAAETAYLAYIDAINERDGEALCALLPASAEDELTPPAGSGSCADRLGRSIGYEDPRGYPVWTGTTLNGIDSISIGEDTATARLTASIVTSFEEREPSVESDIAYLEQSGEEWRLAQPTSALYRAIGQPKLPLSVISPPD